jgi:hypothetical protein
MYKRKVFGAYSHDTGVPTLPVSVPTARFVTSLSGGYVEALGDASAYHGDGTEPSCSFSDSVVLGTVTKYTYFPPETGYPDGPPPTVVVSNVVTDGANPSITYPGSITYDEVITPCTCCNGAEIITENLTGAPISYNWPTDNYGTSGETTVYDTDGTPLGCCPAGFAGVLDDGSGYHAQCVWIG